MATRNTDINLIVRAKTEGEQAISALADAVNHLVSDASTGSKDLAELGRTVAALDKAAVGLATAQEKVGTSATKQADAIHAATQGMAEQRERVETLQRGLSILNTEADKAFVGPKRNGLADLVRVAKTELSDAERQLSRYTNSFDRNLLALQGSRSGLLDLRRSTAEVTESQVAAAAATELNTQALNDQAVATERAARAQQLFTARNSPGALRGAAIDNGAGYGALLENFQRLEAEAAKVRQAIDPLSVAVEKYEERIANVRGAALNGLIGSQEALERERQLHVELQKTLDAIGHVSAAEQDRIRKGVDGLAELSRAEQAQANRLGDRALNVDHALEQSTGVGKLPATAQGATYSELSRLVDQQAAEEVEKLAQAKRSAASAYEQFEARVRSGAAALRDEEQQAERDRATLAALQAKIEPFAAVQARLNAELQRYEDLKERGLISAERYAQAQAHLATESEQARLAISRGAGVGPTKPNQEIGFLGLKPYELQNLGYQVNDVFTQLASGTSLMRTLGQHGGQIVQIFPRITNGILTAFGNPVFLGAAAVLGGIIFGLKEAADQAERLREFTAYTSFRSDGGDYDPKKLSDTARELERMGAKADDAKATIKALLDDGLNPAQLDQFARAAQQTAQRLGESLPAAAKQVADAFSGGYAAVAQLDDKLNFLTASEREHIRALFEEGNANAARTEAEQAFFRQSERSASASRGPWAEAALSLGKAWKSLIDFIADSAPIKLTIGVLAELAGAVKSVADGVNNALSSGSKPAGDAGQRIAEVQGHIRELQKTITDYDDQIAKKSPIAGTLQHLVDQSKRQLADAQAELTKLEKSAPDSRNDDPNSAAAKQRADDLQRISREDELQRLRDAGRVRVLSAAERARREELAGLEAAKASSDAQVAAALKRQAVAHETAQIEKETDERAKAAAADREREIKQFEGRVIGAEGGAGKNPHSTAKGFGQFTESTFLAEFAKVFPDLASQLSREQILALRNNERTARGVIDSYARENAKFLESFGAKVTAGNLYLAHFLGAGGAKAVLTASASTPVDQIIRKLPNGAAALSGNQGYLRTDGGAGRYRTASELRAFVANRVSDTGVAQSEAQQAIAESIEAATRRQNEFNLAIEHGNEDKRDAIRFQTEENGLFGTALIAAQRRQAIANAEREERQKAEDANKNLKPGENPVVVSDEQIRSVKELAAAAFDAAHAKELLNAKLADTQRPIDELSEQRDLLLQDRDLLLSMGDTRGAAAVTKQIADIRTELSDAYEKLIEFYKALSPEQRTELGIVDQKQLDNLIGKLEQAKAVAKGLPDLLGGKVTGREFLDAFSGSAATAFENFIKNVAAGKNVFKSFAEGVREFGASFAQSLAEAILKTLAFALALKALSAITGIPVSALAAIAQFGAAVHHGGGIVGQGTGVTRQLPSAMFAGAQRFHSGGVIGLGPDEQAAVLQKGEEVLTANDPRHRNNGGLAGGGSSPNNLTVINVADHDAAVAQALQRPAGERVLMNFLSDNKDAVKATLG